MYLVNNKNIKSYTVGKVAVPSAMKVAQQAKNTRRYVLDNGDLLVAIC